MRPATILLFCCLAAACLAQVPKPATVSGTLLQRPGKPPAIQTADRDIVSLDGDEPTQGVLNDNRLAGFDLEAKGPFTVPDQFRVDPHPHQGHVRPQRRSREGNRLMVRRPLHSHLHAGTMLVLPEGNAARSPRSG